MSETSPQQIREKRLPSNQKKTRQIDKRTRAKTKAHQPHPNKKKKNLRYLREITSFSAVICCDHLHQRLQIGLQLVVVSRHRQHIPSLLQPFQTERVPSQYACSLFQCRTLRSGLRGQYRTSHSSLVGSYRTPHSSPLSQYITPQSMLPELSNISSTVLEQLWYWASHSTLLWRTWVQNRLREFLVAPNPLSAPNKA
eukprot:3079712-Rhodomonas_salina.2